MTCTLTDWLTATAVLALLLVLLPIPPLWIIGAAVSVSTYAVALLDHRLRRWWL